MKPLSIAVAVLAIAVALGSCKNRKEEPIPGPKAAGPAIEAIAPGNDRSAGETHGAAARPDSGRRHGASGISWFQGTLDEAFSTSCAKCTAMFLRDALDR